MNHDSLDGRGSNPHWRIDNHLRSRVSLADYDVVSGGDATAAFTSALTALASGGTLDVPAGTWLLRQVTVDKPITIRGPRAAIIKAAAALNKDMLIITAPDVRLEGFTVDGNRLAMTGTPDPCHGVVFDTGSVRGEATGLYVHDCYRSGIAIRDTSQVHVHDCHFADNENDVDILWSTHCTVANNYCHGARMEALTAYSNTGVSSTITHGCTFTGNAIDGAWAGISVRNSYSCSISGNNISDATKYGIEVYGTHDVHDVSVTGNTIVGGGDDADAVALQAGLSGEAVANDIVWVGNVVRDWAGYPIQCVGGLHHTFSANRIVACAKEAWFSAAHDITFAGNTIRATSAGPGLLFSSACYNVRVMDNTFRECYQEGMKVSSAAGTFRDSEVCGNRFINNSQSGTFDHYGCTFENACLRVKFCNNTGFDDQSTHTQQALVTFDLTASVYEAWGNTEYNNLGSSQVYNAAATGGAWLAGMRYEDFTPDVGGTQGWIVTAAGTPGTHKAYGVIAA